MEALDGNAAAGAMSEVFGLEVTAARGCCDGCGSVAHVGEAKVYLECPGIVLRCRGCDNVLMVVVEGDGRYWLRLSGLTWVELHS